MLKNKLYEESDINKIHEASVQLLSKKGVKMPSDMALDVFKKAGAKIENNIVYISEKMLINNLEKIPKKFKILARNSKNDFVIGGEKPCFCLPNGPMFVKKGDEYWESQSEDVINFIKLSENSPTINMISPWVATANDVPIKDQLAYQMSISLKYSTKPVMGLTEGYEKSKFSINLIKDFYNKKNGYVTLGLISPISPLSYNKTMLDSIVAYSEENQPIFFSSAVLPGATGPVTMAGTIAVANAEMLAGIVLAQLINPGVPIIYGNATGSADLRFVTPAIGSPEAGLIPIYTRGLANKYGIPCRAGGALCDSKKNDAQAGIESTLVMLSTILSGQDFILHGGGILDSYNVISYDKFILDEEMVKMCLYLKEGLTVNKNTLAMNTIMDIKHGEQYLTEKHTLNNMRSALHNPLYFEKGYYSSWANSGEPTAQKNAIKAAEKRLEEFKEVPLTERQNKLINKYLDVFE